MTTTSPVLAHSIIQDDIKSIDTFDITKPRSSLLSTPTTWKQMRDSDVIKQDKDFSCGASSLATIMNYFYNVEVTELTLLEEIEAIKKITRKRELQDNEITMASFYDLVEVSRKYGFIGKGLATNYDTLKKIKIPAIVYLNHKRTDHFSVVRAINDSHVYLADSSWGNRTLTRKQFEKMWYTQHDKNLQGRVLLILPTTDKQKNMANNEFTKIQDTQRLLRQTPKLFREF